MSLRKSLLQNMRSILWIGEMWPRFACPFLPRTVISHKNSSPPSYQANSWKLFCNVKFSTHPLLGTELSLVGLRYSLKWVFPGHSLSFIFALTFSLTLVQLYKGSKDWISSFNAKFTTAEQKERKSGRLMSINKR